MKNRFFTKSITNTFIGINIVMFLLTLLFPSFITNNFVLYENREIPTYQFITHIFLHGGIIHILFNMIILYQFGNPIERIFKSKKYLILYFGSALLGAFLIMYFKDLSYGMVGASGAIYGIITAFTMLYPNQKVYLFFIIGFKIKYLFLLLILYEITMSILSFENDMTGHLAHIGGAFFAFIYTIMVHSEIKPRSKYYNNIRK